MSPEAITALTGGLCLVIGAVGAAMVARRKASGAEQREDFLLLYRQQAALIESLQQRVSRLDGDLAVLRGEHIHCREENQRLTRRVSELEAEVAGLKSSQGNPGFFHGDDR